MICLDITFVAVDQTKQAMVREPQFRKHISGCGRMCQKRRAEVLLLDLDNTATVYQT